MKTQPLRKYLFPWRPGNRFELLVDGRCFFPRMLEAIESARRHVLLEIYLFESGTVATRFIDALVQAAGRGVTVKLLLDDFGALALSRPDREKLAQGGVALAFYNPIRFRKWLRNMFRDHRKLMVVDGELAFVGGAGITDEFDVPAHPELSWRETVVCARGPVVTDWQALFLRVWNRHASRSPELPTPAPPAVADGIPGRVTITSALAIQEIKRSLYNRARHAEKRLWIATAYFVPSRKLRRVLEQADRRGVDVRLLLPGVRTDHPAIRHAGRRFYSDLLRAGVRIFEYQPRFLHAKTVLCDDWVSIGSSNLDRWNLRWNLEANQEVDDAAFAEATRSMFEEDFRDSVECVYEDWRRRPWHVRWRERLWGRVDIWLENLGRRKAR
ncbi:MAG: phosphatidylserine/phosphatidylglycerophosphate/c ardiolipin synthase family protein [Sulfuricaulis sp.]